MEMDIFFWEVILFLCFAVFLFNFPNPDPPQPQPDHQEPIHQQVGDGVWNNNLPNDTRMYSMGGSDAENTYETRVMQENLQESSASLILRQFCVNLFCFILCNKNEFLKFYILFIVLQLGNNFSLQYDIGYCKQHEEGMWGYPPTPKKNGGQ